MIEYKENQDPQENVQFPLILQTSSQQEQTNSWQQTALLFIPVVVILVLVTSITFIPSFQTFFVSLFEECSNFNFQTAINLIFIGAVSTILMLPFILYELALGYSCKGMYFWPVFLCVISKLIGETTSFGLGKLLKKKLLPILVKYKLFKAIENLTLLNPLKASFLLRLSLVTPQLIINYGSGVLGTIPLGVFMIAANVTGAPHSLLFTLIGKEIGNIKDIFNSNSVRSSESPLYKYIELILFIMAMIIIIFILYKIQQHYKKMFNDQVNKTAKKEEQQQIIINHEVELST